MTTSKAPYLSQVSNSKVNDEPKERIITHNQQDHQPFNNNFLYDHPHHKIFEITLLPLSKNVTYENDVGCQSCTTIHEFIGITSSWQVQLTTVGFRGAIGMRKLSSI